MILKKGPKKVIFKLMKIKPLQQKVSKRIKLQRIDKNQKITNILEVKDQKLFIVFNENNIITNNKKISIYRIFKYDSYFLI